jgi:hypothetical protein
MNHPHGFCFPGARRLRLVLIVGASMAGLCAPLQGAPPFPTLTPAEGLGVNVHFVIPRAGELEMISDAGFKWVRVDLMWAATETKRGVYDFSAYDKLLAGLDHRKMHALLILDYGNPLYAEPGDTQPFTSRAGTGVFRAAFAAWAAAAVEHFAGRGCIWEMWNEPNGTGFWAPTPNTEEYIALARETAAAVHHAEPDEVLIGPAASMMAFDFLEACFQAGLLQDWSAVSVHPYRKTEPGTVAADYRKLRALIDRYAPAGRNIPIVCSEWGYPSSWKSYTEARQANYVPRMFGVNIANGIPLSIWYDWHDDGAMGDNFEHRFGLVHYTYHPGGSPIYDPKPAYQAMKDFAARLAKAGASPGR